MSEQQETAERMSNLANESTQSLLDAAYLAQRQTAQLMEAWLNALGQSQDQQKEIARRLMQQAQEGQQLLQQYVQSGINATTQAVQQGTAAAGQTVNQAAQAAQDTANQNQ